MPSLILHSYRRCPFAIRVRMVLEEKGIPYTVIEESLREPSADLLRFHPEGRVPLLRHGDEVIYESSVITEYLDEAFPGPRLLPADPKQKARMRLWTYWSQTAFKADLDAFKYAPPADEASLAAVKDRLIAHLDKLEAALQAPYLLGPELTLADVHVFPLVRQLSKVAGAPAFPPKVSAWLEGILARPSFARVIAKPMASA